MNIFTLLLTLLALYGLFAMNMIWQRRRRIRKTLEGAVSSSAEVNGIKATNSELKERQYDSISDSEMEYKKDAARGATSAQMTSFVLSIILTANTLLFLICSIFSSSVTAIFSALLLVAVTPVTILVNAAWIFSERITQAEEESIRRGTATLIKIERYLAWAVWVFFTGFAIVVVVLSARQ